jgi:AAA domain
MTEGDFLPEYEAIKARWTGNGLAEAKILDLGEWDAGEDEAPIPPRKWLLGNLFCRQFVSSVLGDGAVGKTSFRIACALAMVTGKPITGDHVFMRCRVLLICFEDGKDELRRRVRAAMPHHGIEAAEVREWLFLATVTRSHLKLATIENGSLKAESLAELLPEVINRRQIDARSSIRSSKRTPSPRTTIMQSTSSAGSSVIWPYSTTSPSTRRTIPANGPPIPVMPTQAAAPAH